MQTYVLFGNDCVLCCDYGFSHHVIHAGILEIYLVDSKICLSLYYEHEKPIYKFRLLILTICVMTLTYVPPWVYNKSQCLPNNKPL